MTSRPRPLGLLGSRGRDIGQDQHVGRFQALGEKVGVGHDFDAPCLGRADPDRQRGGQEIDLRAEWLRRGLAIDQANEQRVLDRSGAKAPIIAGQIIVGELERHIMRPRPGKADREGTRAVS